MLPRLHVGEGLELTAAREVDLPEGAARHVQVLRMQPGHALQVFDGAGREWQAYVSQMGKRHVSVRIGDEVAAPASELGPRVTLAMGMPANDRMDALIEKATELGVHAVQPLVCERSVLRLDGERAAKKVAHWQAVAIAACEQSGRAVVPRIADVRSLPTWLQQMGKVAQDAHARHGVLSLREAISMREWLVQAGAWERIGECAARSTLVDPPTAAPHVTFLSGPEGGLSPMEEQAALDLGWRAITLGRRVLRADTAPLAALSVIACAYEG